MDRIQLPRLDRRGVSAVVSLAQTADHANRYGHRVGVPSDIPLS